MLAISESEIRRHGPGNVLAVFWRQRQVERDLARRGIAFRTTDERAVESAYARMTDGEFEAINGRQAWANWRTIPRAMSGNVPDRPLTIADLGCGTGPSTAVLAFYAPAGSCIYAYELASPLAQVAARRTYRHKTGAAVPVTVVCQGVTETFRDGAGVPLAAGSVDVVNASGVVGHHLTRETVSPLIAELARILTPDGVAMLDVGPTLPAADLNRIMRSAGFSPVGHYRSCFIDRTGEVVYRRARP